MEEIRALPVYVGDETHCLSCGHPFAMNEDVLVDKESDSLFCCTPSDASIVKKCFGEWIKFWTDTIEANLMRYHGNT